MNITYQKRQELNALSQFVFGSSSRWAKLVNKGYAKTLTETTEEMVPGTPEVLNEDGSVLTAATEDSTREIEIPIRYGNSNVAVQVTERHTVESIEARMLELKTFKEELIAAENERKAAAKALAEQKAAEDAVHQALVGSAV